MTQVTGSAAAPTRASAADHTVGGHRVRLWRQARQLTRRIMVWKRLDKRPGPRTIRGDVRRDLKRRRRKPPAPVLPRGGALEFFDKFVGRAIAEEFCLPALAQSAHAEGDASQQRAAYYDPRADLAPPHGRAIRLMAPSAPDPPASSRPRRTGARPPSSRRRGPGRAGPRPPSAGRGSGSR